MIRLDDATEQDNLSKQLLNFSGRITKITLNSTRHASLLATLPEELGETSVIKACTFKIEELEPGG